MRLYLVHISVTINVKKHDGNYSWLETKIYENKKCRGGLTSQRIFIRARSGN